MEQRLPGSRALIVSSIAFVLRAKMRPHSRTIFGLAGEDEC
jgi:hypothetical protein